MVSVSNNFLLELRKFVIIFSIGTFVEVRDLILSNYSLHFMPNQKILQPFVLVCLKQLLKCYLIKYFIHEGVQQETIIISAQDLA